MLILDIERYLSLRRTLGFKLRGLAVNLRAFAKFAAVRGDTLVRASTASDWAATALSPHARHVRLGDVTRFARFAHAEDTRHEVPSSALYSFTRQRQPPYIYAPEEIAKLIAATEYLPQMSPDHQSMYAILFGLIAAAGLRISEALNLRFTDVLPDGILRIRMTKFGKTRLVPLHSTVVEALAPYVNTRRRIACADDHLFLSKKRKGLTCAVVRYTFRRLLQIAEIAAERSAPPRIHDLRHTFATRALERCSTRREEVGRHFIALSTYMGHVDVRSTFWYLEATPEMMTHIATAAEALVDGRRS